MKKMIEECKKQTTPRIKYLSTEINKIIKNKEKNSKGIEQILDCLLDSAIFLGLGKSEFQKLNKYYESVNKKSADFYWDSYEKLMED